MHTTIQSFFDPATWTVSHVIADNASKMAAVVDPALDFDVKSGRTSSRSADVLLADLRRAGLAVQWILETHAHADRLSSAPYIQQQAGGRIAIGENIRQEQAVFRTLYNLERSFLPDGSRFDHLFQNGEAVRIGNVEATALAAPGHTPVDMACVLASGVCGRHAVHAGCGSRAG